MSLTRRRLLSIGAAAVAAGATLPTRSLAEVSIGAMRLQTVSDGHLTLPGDFAYGDMPQDQLLPLLEAAGASRDRYEPECNVTLIRQDDRVILFDVGSGPDFMPSAGALPDTLDAMGLAPEDVTHVVFTHAHPDHIWGLLDDFDDLLFPEASYLIGQAEWDYWTDPDTVDSIGEARAAFAVGAQRRLAAIEDQITLFADKDEILPGIAARASFGHTPGHMSFEVSDAGASALILGDAVANPHVYFARPEWRSGADQDPDAAVAARQSLLDQAASDQMTLVGFHLPGGGIGRAERHGDAYRFVGG